MRGELLQLVANIFIDILEGVEKRGSQSGGPREILDSGSEILFAGVHQSAICVIDDHDFLGAKQIVRDEQGTQRVVCYYAACVADDVRVARFQAQRANRKTGIHARQDREFAFGARSQPAQLMRARINFVCGEYVVDDAHGSTV